jgi:ABC-2 type transport system permease protein
VIRALFYLRAVTLYNRMAVAAARLRQPKYLVSSLVGVAYFYFFFLRRTQRWGYDAHAIMPASIPFASIVTVAGAVLLLVLALKTALSWNQSSLEARLKFSEAEVAFLFPAPLSRLRLLHFHLLGSQFLILLSSVVITVVFDRWSFLGGNSLTHAVGWWIILSTFSLYGTAMNFIAARLQQSAGPGLRPRVLGTLGVLVALLIRRLWVTAHPSPDFSSGDIVAGFLTYLARWIEMSVGPIVLMPFQRIVAPFAAPNVPEFWRALAPALVFPAVCYAIIVLLEVPFREGSIASALRRGEVTAARRSGAAIGVRGAPKLRPRKSPFVLRGSGRPEIAFLWKNLIGIQSWFNWRLLPLVLAVGLFLLMNGAHGHHAMASRAGATAPAGYAPMVLIGTAIVGFYVMLLGPQLIRQDLRSDLLNADLFKAYPLPGWQIVFGQMLTPAIILGALLGLVALAFGWVEFSGFPPAESFSVGTRITLLLCLGLVIPPVVLLQLVIPNAAALLFPAWHQTARTRTGGVEAIGQRLIFTFGQFLMVVIALLPAVITAGLVGWASVGWSYIISSGQTGGGPVSHVFALILATACVLVIVIAEVVIGLWWLGRRFDNLDIASELKP